MHGLADGNVYSATGHGMCARTASNPGAALANKHKWMFLFTCTDDKEGESMCKSKGAGKRTRASARGSEA